MQTFKITIDNRDFVVLCFPGRHKALLDRTVAEIYEVETKQINQAVKRNLEKFPEDFCFELTIDETRTLNEVTNCDLDWKGGHLPKAFTHLGCNMLATILKSPRAVQRAIQIIRTFTALEAGGFGRAIEELREDFESFRQRQEQRQDELEENQKQLQSNLHFLLFEGQSENSPVLQIQNQIRRLEERIETLFMIATLSRGTNTHAFTQRNFIHSCGGSLWSCLGPWTGNRFP